MQYFVSFRNMIVPFMINVQRVYITYAAPDAYAHTNQNKITKLNHIFEFTCGVFSLDL